MKALLSAVLVTAVCFTTISSSSQITVNSSDDVNRASITEAAGAAYERSNSNDEKMLIPSALNCDPAMLIHPQYNCDPEMLITMKPHNEDQLLSVPYS